MLQLSYRMDTAEALLRPLSPSCSVRVAEFDTGHTLEASVRQGGSPTVTEPNGIEPIHVAAKY
jgi:hypothetical protein